MAGGRREWEERSDLRLAKDKDAGARKKKKKRKGGSSDCSRSQWLVNPALESGLCSGYAQNMWLLLWRNEPLNYRYWIVTTEDSAAETTLPTSDGSCSPGPDEEPSRLHALPFEV